MNSSLFVAYLKKHQAIVGLILLMIASLGLHLYLVPRLNIVEDESAYMQDAAQISPSFLPFREFGGTKGPVWLFIFKGWQLLTGRSLLAARLFPITAHIFSIPLLYLLARSFTFSKRASFLATMLWALSPVAVSLSTNVTHIPFELLCVLAAFVLLRNQRAPYAVIWAMMLVWVALLTRATTVAFAPAILTLILIRPDRIKALGLAIITTTALLVLTVAIVYPLYGWPKTAFFFNADATLIAQKQRLVYTTQESVSFLQGLFRAALPLWRDGLSVVLPFFAIPVILIRSKLGKSIALLTLTFLYIPLFQLLLGPFDSAWTMADLNTYRLPLTLLLPASYFIAIYATVRPPQDNELPKFPIILILTWIGGFILFYKGWGRSPTPFYPLESVPALALTSGFVLDYVLRVKHSYSRLLTYAFITLFVLELVSLYRLIPTMQYRGTVEVPAALEMARIMKEVIPAGEEVFTAQPVFPYLSNLPLYGGYTHPGWYLSERAGYMPAEIRQVFLPDIADLSRMVAKDINWMLIDWRTQDVYFNSNTEDTAALRNLVTTSFEEIVVVPNPSSRDLKLYRRK